MSTTFEPRTLAATAPRERPELQEPLRQLDRRIRRYVFLEGLAWAAVFVGSWAAVSFLVDWAFLFRLCGVDYLRDGLVEGHRVARTSAALFLVVGLLGVLAWHWGWRLSVRFRPVDLALVLERRFPGILGDRLITTLELGDPETARRHEVSWPLVETASAEAIERLRQLELARVFDLKRLQRLGLAALLLAGIAASVALLNTDAAVTWADRNLLLREAYWPRPILLQIGGFSPERTRAVPFGSELRLDLRAWKWVVATRDNPEGWRPLEWLRDLLPGGELSRPWELEGQVVSPALFAALPPEWQKLQLDEVNARVEPASAFEPFRREVGLAALRYLRAQLADKKEDELQKELLARSSAAAPLADYLLAAERLPVSECGRLASSLLSPRPLPEDAALSLLFFASGLPAPALPLSVIQKVVASKQPGAPLFAISPEERRRLPASFQALPAPVLVATLRQLAGEDSAEAVGERVRLRLLALFDELDRRADQNHWARRRTFRRLAVPAKVTLEFEQLLEGEERGRVRPKRGQPDVRRQEGSYAYGYEFKKIEQPLRFRALASGGGTLWHLIEVRPLPALKSLVRWHDEPGYLHASDSRILAGPFSMGLEGNEVRGEAPAGSKVRLEGECYKPLAKVNAIAENPLDPAPAQVVHQPGSPTFSLLLRPLGREDLRFQLELTDTDGIPAVRRVVLGSVPDREPEFQRAAFEAVSRKMITPQAILPLSVYLKDDHGLAEAAYDVTVERNDRTVLFRTRLPLRRFQPLRIWPVGPHPARFEKLEEATPGRVLAGGDGLLLAAHSALLRLPQAGIPLLISAPMADLPREFRAAYEDPNLHGPVLRAEDEFLDTLLLRRAAGKPLDTSPWTPPYRLAVRLSALDDRRDESERNLPAHQVGQSPEVFDFLVVNEQELLIEIGKREEEIRDRCEEALAGLKKLRSQIRKLHDDWESYQEADFKRAASDAQDFIKLLEQARRQTDERVLRDFRQAYRELALNRAQPKVLERMDEKICLPLFRLLQPGDHFSQCGEAQETLARRLEAEQGAMPRTALLDAAAPLDRLIARLEEIMGEMRKLIEFNQALQALRDLIKAMDANVKAIQTLEKKKQKEELDP